MDFPLFLFPFMLFSINITTTTMSTMSTKWPGARRERVGKEASEEAQRAESEEALVGVTSGTLDSFLLCFVSRFYGGFIVVHYMMVL